MSCKGKKTKPAKPYNPKEVEEKIYRRWERAKAFVPLKQRRRGQKPFSIVIPPPNVTGSLHMGHALNAVMQDALIRYHRMRGDGTVWVPGTDHAGIATQNVVEKELKKEGKTRHDLGREKFIERVWQWKEKYGRTIGEQLRRIGSSCDWSRERFTMDSDYVRAVQEAFIHYANKGFIYRGKRIVNWCPRCASSISDLEVEYREEDATLYTIKYGPLKVATVRPETKFGDTGVAVHPGDKRYREYVGREIEIETVIGPAHIRVVADEAVDPDFGTGVVKVTPAHDFVDFEIGQRHGLPPRQVIDESGRLNEYAGPFAGMTVEEGRAAVVRAMKEKGLLVKEEPYRHAVAVCSRCGTTIEPLISEQWFVKMADLAKPAIGVVEKGLIRFYPPRWQKVYLDWLRGVKDWCISRQLWWGHRLPVWYCQGKAADRKQKTKDGVKHIVFSVAEPKECPQCGSKKFKQDPDVLDTWFSSALWPFAVFGWPEATDDLTRFYPTAVLVTGRDIIALWVARMVFSALEFMDGKKYLPAKQYGKRSIDNQIPFRDVLINPTVLNLKGQRMSKSLGTGVDPMELIDRYGADATRYGLLVQTQKDQQALHFDENAVRAGRNFVNKLWNIGKFIKGTGDRRQGTGRRNLTVFDQWILARCAAVTHEVTNAIEEYRFGDAMRALHAFVWDDFADWYVEVSKVEGMTSAGVGREVFKAALKLLHPFLPFVTERIWSLLGEKELLMASSWLKLPKKKLKIPSEVLRFKEIVEDLRSLRALLGVPAGMLLPVRIGVSGKIRSLFPAMVQLARLESVSVGKPGARWVSVPHKSGVSIALPREVVKELPLADRVEAIARDIKKCERNVAQLKSRIAKMKRKAPEEVISRQQTLLQEQKLILQEQKTSLRKLRSFVQKV